MIEKLQTNYKEKLVASRDSLMEIIKLNKSDFEEKLIALQSEVKNMVTESHEVQNKQLESLRKDTES